MVEVAGVEPASGSIATGASTSVALVFVSHRNQPGRDTPVLAPIKFPAAKEERPPLQVACFYDTLIFSGKHGKEGRAALSKQRVLILVWQL
jgi:hypothetical protein